MTDVPKLNLRQKLVQVYSEIDHVEKAGTNEKQRYSFVRAADVLRAIRDAFAKLGIYAETNYELLGTYDIKTNSGGTMHTATVKATITLYDADSDETKTISGLGDGADWGTREFTKPRLVLRKTHCGMDHSCLMLPMQPMQDPEADEDTDKKTEVPVDARNQSPPVSVTRATPHLKKIPLPGSNRKTNICRATPPMPIENTKNQGPASRLADSSVDTTPPTEEELNEYRKKFSKLGDDLSDKGKLKSSKGLPINRKIVVFLLEKTGATDAAKVTKVQWDHFFERVDYFTALDNGWVGLAKLINQANGIEEKEKK